MKFQRQFSLLICILLLSILIACDNGSTGNDSSGYGEVPNDTTETASDDDTTTITATATTTDTDSTTVTDDDSSTASDDGSSDQGNTEWDDSEAIEITLSESSISVDSSYATVSGSIATITSAGVYRISGTLSDGQIAVDTEDQDTVVLILDGVEIQNSTSAPINIISAEEVELNLAANSTNLISDGSSYVFEDSETDEPNAAIFSKDALTISGSGSLTVEGNYLDGIACKDGLLITGGNIDVTAADDGIRGKDYLVIEDGSINVNAQGDGLKSTNDSDTTLGYVSISGGTMEIAANGDGISAETDVSITGGDFTITTGGGSNNSFDESSSVKGIKATVGVSIGGGTFNINAADDAIHADDHIEINDGELEIASGDDGIHAEAALEFNGGDIKITQSYEGIEGAIIIINDGSINLIASDDGVNVSGDNNGTDMPGEQASSESNGQYLSISGGYLAVDADGDGIDVNGAFEMSGGDVVVHGPTDGANSALDYTSCNITGGFIVAAGSSGMAMVAGSTSSSQNGLLLNFTSSQQANSLVHIQTESGEGILTFAPSKAYQSITLSSPDLTTGTSYQVYTGGSSSGTAVDGLYQDGSYSGGSEYTTFTVSGTVTTVGSGGDGGGNLNPF